MPKPLQRGAVRCDPYSDGPWFFAYDPAHVDRLNELDAYDALLGHASGADADSRVSEVAEAGLAVACELGHDLATIDVLVGKKLGANAKKKAEWVDAQRGFLRVTSGRLRIDSLNTVLFGRDAPDSDGCELDVPAGDYDVVVRRVAFELMDDEEDGTGDQLRGLPAAVLELLPAGKNGPKTRAACLTLAEARGEVGAWLAAGRVEDGAFHGMTRAVEYEPHTVNVNLRGTHAEALGLRFGSTLVLTSGDVSVSVPFIGYMAPRGMDVYFGSEWCEAHLDVTHGTAGFSPFQASTPWLVEVDGSGLPAGAPVVAKVGEPWCDPPRADPDRIEVGDGFVKGKVAAVSPATIILDFGWDALRDAGLGDAKALDMVVGSSARTIRFFEDPSKLAELRRAVLTATSREAYFESPVLLANTMTHWDDPAGQLIWLMPLLGESHWAKPTGYHPAFLPGPGDRHGLEVAAGESVTVRSAGAPAG